MITESNPQQSELIDLSLNISYPMNQPFQELTAANRILRNYKDIWDHQLDFNYAYDLRELIRVLDFIASDYTNIVFCNLIKKELLYANNTSIEPHVLKKELTILCSTAKKIIEFVFKKFNNNNKLEKVINYLHEPTSIKNECARIESMAIQMAHHIIFNDEFLNEKLLILSHNDSDLKVFPKEIIQIITKNMFEIRLNDLLRPFNASFDVSLLRTILAKVEKPYIGITPKVLIEESKDIDKTQNNPSVLKTTVVPLICLLAAGIGLMLTGLKND